MTSICAIIGRFVIWDRWSWFTCACSVL